MSDNATSATKNCDLALPERQVAFNSSGGTRSVGQLVKTRRHSTSCDATSRHSRHVAAVRRRSSAPRLSKMRSCTGRSRSPGACVCERIMAEKEVTGTTFLSNNLLTYLAPEELLSLSRSWLSCTSCLRLQVARKFLFFCVNAKIPTPAQLPR